MSYNGHSNLGSNIFYLEMMGSFQKGQYQVFFVNGCDTFAYVEDTLVKAHHDANPDAAPTKYFGYIVNAMPSYFNRMAESNMAILTSLADEELSYFEILRRNDPHQKALVVGEEDNAWLPKP